MRKISTFLIAVIGFIVSNANDTIYVDVNLDVLHKIDTVTSFDRAKFVTIHADAREPDWDRAPNSIADTRDDFLNGYDVYLGRTTHNVNGPLSNSITEDPNRIGYADSNSIVSYGESDKAKYALNTNWHQYEWRDDEILCNLDFPFIPVGIETNTGWALSQADTQDEPFGTASGEFYGRFIREAYGTGGATGQPAPKYIEIVNEPMWPLFDWNVHDEAYNALTMEQTHKFHKTVAQEVRKYVSDIPIGGYVTAHPNFEVDNFDRWKQRWKAFVDIAGDEMDYWAIHLYDHGSGNQLRKGSNMEATMEMIDQYSYLKFGYAKPYVISEYGGTDNAGVGKAYSSYHDWLHMKAVNSMMLQFMERPQLMLKTINYTMLKGSWTGATPEEVWGARLFRRAGEPESMTGDWVYTERVKTFQLWSDVKGTRVDSRATNLDILTDAYVNGDKAYVIVNSLKFDSVEVSLNIQGLPGNIQSVKIKEMYCSGLERGVDSVILEEIIVSEAPESMVIQREGTYILEYTFDSDIAIADTIIEVKHYSDTILIPIAANNEMTFNINGINKGENGEALLRVGLDRDHGKSLQPEILVNGVEIPVPDNFRGDPQVERDTYFGVLEIPVSYNLVQADNEVKIVFTEDGGHVSTVTMQTFDFTRNIDRSDDVASLNIYPNTIEMGVGQVRQLTAMVMPEYAADKRVTWSSSNETFVTIDENGTITGEAEGSATVTAISVYDGSIQTTCNVTVGTDIVPVLVDTIIVTPLSADLIETKTLQLEYEILPVDADDKSVTWTTTNGNATVNNGLVTAVSEGMVEVKAIGANGKVGMCSFSIINRVPGTIELIDESSYSQVDEGTSMVVNLSFTTSTGETMSSLRVSLDLMDSDDKVVKGYTAYANSLSGETFGTDSVTLGSRRAAATADLPAGQYYRLEVRMTESDGNVIIKEVSPVVIGNGVGIDDELSESVYIYPNPAKEILNISGLRNNIYNINIYTTQGSLVFSETLNYLNDKQIDISELTEGAYLLNISGDKINKTMLLRK